MKLRMFAGVLLVGAIVPAQENVMNVMRAPAAVPPAFVRPDAIDYTALLPVPAAPGTIAAQAELDAILQVQASRTPAQIAWARLIDQDHIFNHAEIIGPWFAAERLPRTAAFFKALGGDLKAADAAAKRPFQRARPWEADARVEPCVPKPASTSYPSGTALQALVWAELLAEVFPERRAALIDRAHRAGWGRVIGGVHFPGDVAAGRALAPAFLAECRKSPAFREAWAAVQAEIRAARP